MAVIRTGDIFKSFTFDGEDSRNYGVYITGDAVYNAPERSVEMISIPGRNGAYVLDNGHFENIEVTYPAGVFGETEADFAAAISALRNMLCSRRGYKRLSDDYNTGEYREAVYKSGLEVEPAQLRAGEFEITFECKPQRFLTAGENTQTLASGASVNNPSLFPSSPLLEADGYGDIDLGADTITVQQKTIGNVVVADGGESTSASWTITPDLSALETGDAFSVQGLKWQLIYRNLNIGQGFASVATNNGDFQESVSKSGYTSAGGFLIAELTLSLDSLVFAKGTNSSGTKTSTVTLKDKYTGTTATETLSMAYSYSSGTITFTLTMPSPTANWDIRTYMVTWNNVIGISTRSANSHAYIDLDIGEAWSIINGVVVPINNIVEFPSELPTLKSGTTTITYDNTITSFKITPRWWKI